MLRNGHTRVGDALEFVVHFHHGQHAANGVLIGLSHRQKGHAGALNFNVGLVNRLIGHDHYAGFLCVRVKETIHGLRAQFQHAASLNRHFFF